MNDRLSQIESNYAHQIAQIESRYARALAIVRILGWVGFVCGVLSTSYYLLVALLWVCGYG